jgi:hypothetical protein
MGVVVPASAAAIRRAISFFGAGLAFDAFEEAFGYLKPLVGGER